MLQSLVHERNDMHLHVPMLQLGYFATDLLLLVVHYPAFGGPEMAVHHVAALVSVAAAAFQVWAAAAVQGGLALPGGGRWPCIDSCCVFVHCSHSSTPKPPFPSFPAGSSACVYAGIAGNGVHHAVCEPALGARQGKPAWVASHSWLAGAAML